jgi:hypothetical protein
MKAKKELKEKISMLELELTAKDKVIKEFVISIEEYQKQLLFYRKEIASLKKNSILVKRNEKGIFVKREV